MGRFLMKPAKSNGREHFKKSSALYWKPFEYILTGTDRIEP